MEKEAPEQLKHHEEGKKRSIKWKEKKEKEGKSQNKWKNVRGNTEI